MKSLLRVIALGLAFAAYPLLAVAQAPESTMGTWKRNAAKSKCSPGPCSTRSSTLVFEKVPGGMKMTVDGVNADGSEPRHLELVTMFDGKEAEYKGAAAPTTRLYSRIDDNTYEWVTRVNGKVTTTVRATISADGKTRTLVGSGTNADGEAVNYTTVWDRQ